MNLEGVSAKLIDLEDDSLETVNHLFCQRKWTDGLPIVPPTETRVAAMLRCTDLPAGTILGKMAPRWRPCDVHHVAINAVMAGCRPEYLPVVQAAVQAMLDPLFNLNGVQATTNPCGVMIVVNGPVARELNVNCGFNLFGQGWQANATVGRAIRLCMINIGGGLPGVGDMSTLGNPGKYSGCIAENESASPWTAYHVEKGFDPSVSTVTVIGTAAPQNVIDMSGDPTAIAESLARAMIVSGSNCMYIEGEPMVVVGPVHARHLSRGGFDKAALRQYLWEHGKVELGGLHEVSRNIIKSWKKRSVKVEDGRDVLYVTERPEQIGIVVAGGEGGPHSAVLAPFNGTHLVTRPIARSDGTPVHSVQELMH